VTTQISTNGATTLSRVNTSGYKGHVTIFSRMFTIACGLVGGLRLGLWLGLALVSGWFVVMHTYLYYFRLSLLSHVTLAG